MDPLSVTASVIAVVQAAQSVYDGVQKFRDGPKEFSDFKTELCELIRVSTQVWHCVKVIDNDEHYEKQDTDEDGLLGPDELDRLKLTATDLKSVIEDIGKVVEASRDPKGKLNRILWFRKNAAASKDLRKRARALQSHLTFHVSSLTPMQMARHNRETMEHFKTLQQLVAATEFKHKLPQRQWEPGPEKPWRRVATQSSLAESLPPYSKKESVYSIARAATDAKWTPSVQHSTPGESRTSLSDAKAVPSQYSNQFPEAPSNEPSSCKDQSDRSAEAVGIAITEPCATVTDERKVSNEPMNKSLSQGTKSINHEEQIDSIQLANYSPDILGILNAQVQKPEDENAPGSVGGLLEFEALPPPEVPETASVASQELDIGPRETQESTITTFPEKMEVTLPQWSPPRLSHYEREGFRNDHLGMYACSCPRSATIGPPSWFTYFFGAFIFVYSMTPVFASLVCCNTKCKSKSKRHIRLFYRLPECLVTNTCLSIFCWDSVYGYGRLLEWRRSREIDAPEVVVAIEKGDVRWLQRQVAANELRPFDILKGVGDPLAYSLANINSDCGIEVINFLLRSGFHSLSTSYQICSASYTAKMYLRIGIDYEQRHIYSVLQDIADLDQNSLLDSTTTIHDAALHLTSKTLREVLVKGREGIDGFDGLGFTALHWSVMREDMPHVKSLLKAGADVNMPTAVQMWSPLHIACMKSSSELVSLLIEAGAKLDHEDHQGQTPLHYVPIRHASLVDLLLTRGADSKHEDYYGNNILHNMARRKPPHPSWARRHEEPRYGLETVLKFLQRGVGMDVPNARGETPTMLLVMHNSTVLNEPDLAGMVSFKERFPDHGWNIMHYAACYWDQKALCAVNLGSWGFYDCYEWLGFDPDARDKDGKTPLDLLEHRMFAPDEERMAGVYRPTREEVRTFVSLLRFCREDSWDQGCYLDTKQRFLEDGSLDKMDAWLAIQRDQSRRVYAGGSEDRKYGEIVWQMSDPWFRDYKRPGDVDLNTV